MHFGHASVVVDSISDCRIKRFLIHGKACLSHNFNVSIRDWSIYALEDYFLSTILKFHQENQVVLRRPRGNNKSMITFKNKFPAINNALVET